MSATAASFAPGLEGPFVSPSETVEHPDSVALRTARTTATPDIAAASASFRNLAADDRWPSGLRLRGMSEFIRAMVAERLAHRSHYRIARKARADRLIVSMDNAQSERIPIAGLDRRDPPKTRGPTFAMTTACDRVLEATQLRLAQWRASSTLPGPSSWPSPTSSTRRSGTSCTPALAASRTCSGRRRLR